MRKDIKFPLVDSLGLQDIFISGVACIENLAGGCVRVTLYVERTSPYDGTLECHVAAHLVMSAETLRQTGASIDREAEADRPGDKAVH